jgi:hypothetical protein
MNNEAKVRYQPSQYKAKVMSFEDIRAAEAVSAVKGHKWLV